MILQALKDYYYRKAGDPEGGIAPEGFEYKEIPFLIVLDKEGRFVQIEDTRTKIGKHKRARSFCVPHSVKKTSNSDKTANLLWENAEYTLGLDVKSSLIKTHKKQETFLNRICELQLDHDMGVYAVLKFLQNIPIVAIEQDQYFPEIKKTNPIITFKLNTEAVLICQRNVIVSKIKNSNPSGETGSCLITGNEDVLARLQPAIKGVRDTNKAGGNIVSFNLSAFNSYRKEQGANAPIGEKASFAYTTALNHLLGKDSKQKIQVGDATTVFWSDKKSNLEDQFSTLFDEPQKDNPDALTDAVKALYQSVDTGVFSLEDKSTRFFVLGLSPNAARISIRFWHIGTISEFSKKIAQHFYDLEIDHGEKDKDHLSMWRMMKSLAAREDTKNISPCMAGDWMRSILAGTPYPESVYQAALRRIQVERRVLHPQAAIIKGYLNRKAKFQSQPEKEITVSLDQENRNIGYRLGRLFATLEKIQEEAQPEINKTIRDRYYAAASGTPASVLPILMRLKNHHLAKLEKTRVIYFEKLLGEIMSEIVDFANQLNLQDQGRFAIGYYHQRQAFFKKSESHTTTQGE